MRLSVLDSHLASVRSGTAGVGAITVLPARLSKVARATCTTPDLRSSVLWVVLVPTRSKRTGSFSGSDADGVTLMGASDVQSNIGVTDWLVFHG